MKKVNNKIKIIVFILIIILVLFLIFSSYGIIFTSKDGKQVILSSKQNNLKPNSYIASVVSKSSNSPKEEANEIKTFKDELTFENKTVLEVAEVLDKTFEGALAGQGELFAILCMEKGMDPYLAAAISAHETANGKSSAARVKNNFGGIMCRTGLCTYSTKEAGITKFINNIYKNYYSKGLTTPNLMAKKYAADPAWPTRVNNWYKQIKNK